MQVVVTWPADAMMTSEMAQMTLKLPILTHVGRFFTHFGRFEGKNTVLDPPDGQN